MPLASGAWGVWVAPGPEQGSKLGVPVSIEHAKLDPASEEWKAKLGVVLVVDPEGPESIVVSGGAESSV